MITAMSGACVAAERNAPMPTRANAHGSGAAAGNTPCTALQKSNPPHAPMKSDGVNTPPGAPEPNDAIVASHLHAKMPAITAGSVLPLRIFTITGYPLPHTSGTLIA